MTCSRRSSTCRAQTGCTHLELPVSTVHGFRPTSLLLDTVICIIQTLLSRTMYRVQRHMSIRLRAMFAVSVHCIPMSKNHNTAWYCLCHLNQAALKGHAAVDMTEWCNPCSQKTLQRLAAACCLEPTFDWLRLGALLAGAHSGDKGLHNYWQSKRFPQALQHQTSQTIGACKSLSGEIHSTEQDQKLMQDAYTCGLHQMMHSPMIGNFRAQKA